MGNTKKIDIQELMKNAKDVSILYVEDEELLRERTFALFNKIFTHVDMAVNGEDGLEKYRSKKYHIVITDILMPKMNGYELIHEIVKENKKQEIVILSALTEEESKAQRLCEHEISCINKPVELNQMLQTLNTIVNKLQDLKK
jgi:YesN/AraC family two-component response regulator